MLKLTTQQPDTNVNGFNNHFDNILINLKGEHKHCYLVGDFNINLLHIHSPTNNFIITLLGHSFVPVIDKPTRVTPNSASLIDNIFTNTNTRNSMTGILVTIAITFQFFISLIAKSILQLL